MVERFIKKIELGRDICAQYPYPYNYPLDLPFTTVRDWVDSFYLGAVIGAWIIIIINLIVDKNPQFGLWSMFGISLSALANYGFVGQSFSKKFDKAKKIGQAHQIPVVRGGEEVYIFEWGKRTWEVRGKNNEEGKFSISKVHLV